MNGWPPVEALLYGAQGLQGRRADKKLARGEVLPLLLKIDGFVGLETAFAFLKMAPDQGPSKKIISDGDDEF